MKRPLHTCFVFCLFCLGLAAFSLWAIVASLRQAELAFGPPASSLGLYQRFYLPIQLLLQEKTLKLPTETQGISRPFVVALGESTYSITDRLQTEGLIHDAQVLRDYLVYTGMDTSLQAGEYTLSPRMSPIEIAYTMQDATPSEVTFRILAGWRIEEIAASLPTSGLNISPEVFLAAAAHPPASFAKQYGLPSQATLEGFLFPDGYRFSRQAGLQDFIAALLEDFQIKLGRDLQQGFKRQGLTTFQAVTLASIIEREAIVEDEMPIIASVFLNRLAAGMRLDSDSTTQYALGFNTSQNTWWTNPLTLDDLKVDSPYNTYIYPGLPPGPIANPGLYALQAVAFPAQTPYYYFRAACDGSGRHAFAATFAEHQQNACP